MEWQAELLLGCGNTPDCIRSAVSSALTGYRSEQQNLERVLAIAHNRKRMALVRALKETGGMDVDTFEVVLKIAHKASGNEPMGPKPYLWLQKFLVHDERCTDEVVDAMYEAV